MTDTSRQPLRTIAVFGGGIVGWTAALTFARALPRTVVTLVATPTDPAALADRLPATLPATAALLDTIGIGEAALVRAGATHRLASRFIDWPGEAWFDAYGAVPGADHQLWFEQRRIGAKRAWHGFFPGAALAEGDRFALGDAAPGSLWTHDHALRLDPGGAVRVLADHATRAGIHPMRAAIDGVERNTAGVSAVRLVGGQAVRADLFIDATGPGATLAAALDPAFEAWGEALPVDRLLLAPRPGTPSPRDDYRAIEIGWRAVWPLAGVHLHGLGWASAITGEGRARRTFGPGIDTADLIAVTPGRRRAPWTGNVLALGDAAAATGPLGWTGLALAHAHLALALALLPDCAMEPLLIAEYNRRANLRSDRLRDFLAAHYLVRRRGAFWEPRRQPPASLAATLAQFAQRGLLPHHDEESVEPANWIAVLAGQGTVPCRRDPVAMSADPAAAAALDRLGTAIARAAAGAATYPAALARMAGRSATAPAPASDRRG